MQDWQTADANPELRLELGLGKTSTFGLSYRKIVLF